MELCTSVIWICLLGLLMSTQGSAAAQPQSTQDNAKTIELRSGPERLRENMRQSLETRTITSIRGAILTQSLWSKQRAMATRSRLKIVADPNGFVVRQRLAKEILGIELYNELESHLLKVVEAMTDVNGVQVALRVLGRGLSSPRARPILKKLLQDSIKKLEDPNDGNVPHPHIFIGLAEALCYMSDESGLDVLDAVLKWEDDPSGSATREAAILALASLATTKAKAVLLCNSDRVLSSENAIVAYSAFDYLRLFDEFKPAISHAACQQLVRLADAEESTLAREDLMVLTEISLVIRDRIQRNELTESERDAIKQAAMAIITQKSVKYGERVALLFAMLAGNQDAENIAKLITSQSTHVKAQGIRSLVNCDREIQKRFLPDLIRLLDDPYWYTRDIALYVIRRYKGEITGSGLPKDVFLKERERIKQWWKDEQKAKTDQCD